MKLECRPWQVVVNDYDRDDTLMYMDPPYHPGTLRSKTPLYRYDLSADEHVNLLLRLKRCQAKVVLCGYPHPTYDLFLSDWVRLDKEN